LGQHQSFNRQKNYTIADGLVGNRITALLQDSKGFLWIGTEDGLNRYDGARMVEYRHRPSDSLSLSDNLIQVLFESKDGNLWIGTRNGGLSKWERSTNHFMQYHADAGNKNSLPENDICGLLADKNGVLWIKSRNYLIRFNSQNNTFESYGHYANVFKHDDRYNYPIQMGDNGIIWVGTKDGLNKFDTKTKTFTRIGEKHSPINAFQEPIWDILPYSDVFLLVSTSQGLMKLDLRVETLTKCNVKDDNIIVDKLLKTKAASVIGGGNGCLTFLDTISGETIKSEMLQVNNQKVEDQITTLLEDKSGIIWIGTKHSGLFKVDFRLARFQKITSKTLPTLPFNNISSLYLDSLDQLWIGTIGKGLYVLDRQDNKVSSIPLNSSLFKKGDDVVFSIFKDRTGTFWIGTNHGIYQFNEESGRISEFDYCNNTEFANLLRNNEIRSFIQDRKGYIWIGTRFGLYKYNGSQLESFFSEKGKSNSLCNDEVNSLALDNDGNLWIGTSQGVNVIDRKTGVMKSITNQKGQSPVLSNENVLTLAADIDGNMWIGTRLGLTQYHIQNQKSNFFYIKDGLKSDVINGITFDNMGRIWVSTNKGISCFNHGIILNFDEEDGLAGTIFNQCAVYKSKSGELFFGGYEGINYLSPGILENNINIPNIAITEIKLYDQGRMVNSYLGEQTELRIKYLKNSTLRIEFAALEYTQPFQNKYKVMLEGFDKDWSPVTSDNFVVYSNLPPGQYILKILGSNNDLVWSTQAAQMGFTIDPPLWRSVYAVLFYLLALFFIIQGIVNYRVRYYRKAYNSLRDKAFDKKKIEAQKEALSKINKSLTDSINYAKRIQEGMLLSEELVKRFINDSFVYYRPKDIVSGDFYYFYSNNNKLIVAAVDCTGHGVPGAFMSIIGYDLMRNVIEIQGIECPAVILNTMNRQLLDTFKKEVNPSNNRNTDVNDGMDIALCVIDFDRKVVEFAGANNSMYLVHENEIETYEGNRFALGLTESFGKFTKQEISLHENDIIYLFSDGYADQFGGPEGKKLKYRRFRHLLLNIHKLPFEDQKAILHQKMEEWMGETYEQVDDMLLIGLKPLEAE
jgi:ligand-binding sensor domain-containing protein/serine phosphatase RsbU (regulator of sigma subunit)